MAAPINESDPKKRKLSRRGEHEEICATFFKTYAPQDMDILKKAIKSLLSDKRTSLKACSLTIANCCGSVSFNHAYVNVVEHIDKLFPLGAFFTTGLGILINFLKTKSAPVVTKERLLLEILLTYLLDKDVHEALSSVGRYCKTGTDVTVMIVNHLLQRIMPNTRCILNKGVLYNLFPLCPDHCEIELKNTKIDDTSIGNQAVWHGRLDALIGHVAMKSFSDSDDNDDYEDDDDDDDKNGQSYADVKQKFMEIDIPNPRVISQAIVFSFLQNQQHSHQNTCTLIPTIGVSSSQLVIYFYDSENDVLLQSAGFFFNRGGEDRIKTILVAWLVMNYKHLCDGLIDDLTTVHKANFFSLCDDEALEIYKYCLTHRGVGNGETQSLSVYKYEHSCLEIPPAAKRILDDIACL